MEKEPIPQDVIDALAVIRESGVTNMFARDTVMEYMAFIGEETAEDWLFEHKDRYMDALIEMGNQIGMINE